MHSSLLIFVVAFFVRILNLYLHQIDSSTYLIEDQLIYWEWSLNNAYTSNNLLKDSLLAVPYSRITFVNGIRRPEFVTEGA